MYVDSLEEADKVIYQLARLAAQTIPYATFAAIRAGVTALPEPAEEKVLEEIERAKIAIKLQEKSE